ncbi:hypothetical protein GCM10007973_12180 [Polymorphobacter multimanifer]|uniref:Uncharacterized protein n=1 Tax=Polymorphobacter multimanifer TaxID=1070431 RepID=A0A841L5R8_9SPHN|nr:hypothetical protein [Polymorphobacter multimanifer]MBB6227770.1 hypothetical protein [Polymorphobacter multimanifer]GGI76894.1 hypothetical protein GCM10007973_12180 [Polymorphobacter multimanifer]
MSRTIRDYVVIPETASLDALIERLTAIRDGAAHGLDAKVRLRGDDDFGRHIAVVFDRPLTAVEAGLERRYAEVALKVAA